MRSKIAILKSTVLMGKKWLKRKQNKIRLYIRRMFIWKRRVNNDLPVSHKHFCSFCGGSADVEGSFCHSGVYACPLHVTNAVSNYFHISKRGQK